MNEQNDAANKVPGPGDGRQGVPSPAGRKPRWGLKDLPDGGSPVGSAGIMATTAFLVVLIVVLLWGITQGWPVCDLEPSYASTATPTPSAENANRGASPGGNVNSSTTPGANTNAATNANAPANTNTAANANANTNAIAGAQTNANVPAPTPSPRPSPSPAASDEATKLDADSLEPSSGPIRGKTLVTVKGKNFGTTREGIEVKFGESPAKVNQVTDKAITVTTTAHSEGVVDVTVAKGGAADTLTSAYTYTCPPPSGTGLYFMVVMAGALGGCIHALRSLYWYFGQGELKWRWMPMYVSLPFLGAAMAMLFSLVIIAGLVDQAGGGRSQALFIIAIGGLVGMFSQQAALKLTDVANAFFTKPGPGKDSKPQESLSVGQQKVAVITATAMSPTEGPIGTQVKITGTGFSNSTTVTFGDVPAKVTSVDSASITVEAPIGTGPVELTVKSGEQSTKVPGQFTYQ